MKHLLLCLLLLSCGMDDQKKYYRLEGLRMLAISADNPEINSASTVTLTPYLSYTDGGDTTLDVSWEACLDPGISYGAEIKCDTDLDSGSDIFNTATLNSVYYTGPMNTISVNIPTSAFTYLASINSETQFNGVDVIVIVQITDQNNSSSTLKTIKRIKLTSKTSGLNINPTISGNIQSNGSDLSSAPAGKVNLSLDGLSSAESYSYQATSGLATLDERMLVTWFASFGEFTSSRTDPDESTEFDPQGGTTGVLVGVYRDGRGGLAIKRVTF